MATGTIPLHLLAGQQDGTLPAPATLFTAAGRPYLAFDQTTDEVLTWVVPVPANFASALAINVGYAAGTATSGVVRVRSQIMCAADGHEVDVDDFQTLESSADVTVPGTAGLRDTVTYTPSNTDSIAASSHLAIQLGRENAVTGTNLAEDMWWFDVWLTYTTT